MTAFALHLLGGICARFGLQHTLFSRSLTSVHLLLLLLLLSSFRSLLERRRIYLPTYLNLCSTFC